MPQYQIYSELEQKLNKTLNQRFPELTFANGVDVPIEFTLEPGAESVSVDEIKAQGEAGLLGAEASDIPLVQVSVGKTLAPVVMAVAGYSIGFKADRAYSFSGKSSQVTSRSVLAVRRAIDERIHFFIAYGEAALGIRGLYNNAAVTPIASAFNPDTATYDDYIDFFVDQVLTIGLNGFNTMIPTDVLISRAMMKKLANKRPVGTGVANSALVAINEAVGAIDGYGITIRVRPESDSAMLTAKGVLGVPANKDRIVIYRKDPMSLAMQMEKRVAQMMPAKYIFSDPKLSMNYPMFSCASATQIYDPGSVAYIDVTKPA